MCFKCKTNRSLIPVVSCLVMAACVSGCGSGFDTSVALSDLLTPGTMVVNGSPAGFIGSPVTVTSTSTSDPAPIPSSASNTGTTAVFQISTAQPVNDIDLIVTGPGGGSLGYFDAHIANLTTVSTAVFTLPAGLPTGTYTINLMSSRLSGPITIVSAQSVPLSLVIGSTAITSISIGA